VPQQWGKAERIRGMTASSSSPAIHRVAQPLRAAAAMASTCVFLQQSPVIQIYRSCMSPQPRFISSISYGCALFSVQDVAVNCAGRSTSKHGTRAASTGIEKDAQVAGQGLACALGVDKGDRHEVSSQLDRVRFGSRSDSRHMTRECARDQPMRLCPRLVPRNICARKYHLLRSKLE
jgi:hypothetical protein